MKILGYEITVKKSGRPEIPVFYPPVRAFPNEELLGADFDKEGHYLIDRGASRKAYNRLKQLYVLGYNHGRRSVKRQGIYQIVEKAHSDVKGLLNLKVRKEGKK